jgi:outer membrane receptor protein involved in Fe transport
MRRRFAGGEQLFLGGFIHHDRAIAEQWRVSLDLRVDRWQDTDGHLREVVLSDGAVVTREIYPGKSGTEFSPRAGLVWKFSPGWKVRGAAYQAFRVPTLNEYYRPFRVGTVNTLANASLREEILTGGEAGVDFTCGNLKVEATGFLNRLENAVGNITLNTAPSLTTRQRQNIDEVRIHGAELAADWNPRTTLGVRVSYLWSESDVIEAPMQPALVGKRLAQTPEHKITGSVSWRPSHEWDARISARYVSEQFDDDENQLPLREAISVDLRVQRRLGTAWVVFVSVDNLFAENVETSRSPAGLFTYDSPRWMRGGVRLLL